MDLAALELQKTHERFDRNVARIIRQEGYGASPGALMYAEQYLTKVADAITQMLARATQVHFLDANVRHLLQELVSWLR
jgi:hypothetical protein